MSTNPIRVLIADAQPIVLEGLRSVLSHYSDIEVVADATDGVEAIDKAVHLEPDIILLDPRMPRVDGLTVLRSIQTRAPRSKVIFFASAENKDEFVEAMKLGCSGILLKETSTALIEKSIHRVNAGEIWLDSTTTAAVIRHFASPKDFPAAHAPAGGTPLFPSPKDFPAAHPPSHSAGNGKAPRERAQLSQREREIIVLI